ncbi:hypothetical protein KO489_08490 [Reinekea forsetii]|nr:hypothetical protein [Reinekea forsetii]
MKEFMKHQRTLRFSLVPLALSTLIGQVIAADLAMTDEPLFLKSGVQPNIFFVVDDSGSMGWNALNSPGANEHWNITDSWVDDDDIDITPTLNDQVEILRTCPGFNVMYYNPNQTYTPWQGVDKDGNVFANQPITAAEKNPYLNDGDVVDLTEDGSQGFPAGYFTWYDHNNDGYLDKFSNATDGKKDTGTLAEMECPDYEEVEDQLSTTAARENFLKTWFVDTSEMTPAQQTNFANWYSYYRKREFVAKRAMSEIVYNSSARMGLSTLHNHNSVVTEIKDVDNLSTPVNPTAQSNKDTLLDNVFKISSNNGTPLRTRLKRAGEYYKGNGLSGVSNAASPILSQNDGGSCQQNFTIMMTDGVWNGSSPSLGNSYKNADSNNDSDYDGLAGDKSKYADKDSGVNNTLADVAMHYYETDLDTNLPNNVPTFTGIDENSAQHMVTYTVAFGLTGDLDEDEGPDSTGWLGWPTPVSNEESTIDDVWHAAINGRGLFLSAADPDELITSLNATISDIQGRDASASAVSVNTGSISSDTMVFQAEFNSQTWGGKLYGVEIELDGSIGDVHLASIVPAHNDRVIFTYNDLTNDGAPFRWNSISLTQQSELNNSEPLLNYLRGDDTLTTAGTHRDRVTLEDVDSRAVSPLGDIVNSSPIFVGNPEYFYPDNLEGASYNAFKKDPNGDNQNYREETGERVLHRKPMIYVGANDGMLHAFNADTHSDDFGMEEFAYVPASVYSRLERLGDKSYSHKYTVDGSPAVADVYYDGSWKTILVSGLGGGGQGLFALDITNPETGFDTEANAANNVLWEFTDVNDSDLGYTFAQPVIGKSNINGRWVAFVGNGYNNTESDGFVGSGTAKLFVIDVETGLKLAEIDTFENDLSTPNGLSTVNTLDVDGDYIVDYVYGGDIEGNLWKFDVSDGNPANWSVSTDVLGNIKPLFTTCTIESTNCPTDKRQPITVKPQIALNRGATGYVVFFGTGTYFLRDDNTNKGTQSFYGIWDRMEDHVQADFNRFHLLEQKIVAEVQPTGSDNSFRATTSYDTVWFNGSGLPTDGSDPDSLVDTHLGWYMDFVNTQNNNTDGLGERLVSDPQLRDNNIIFTTSIPDQDPCSFGGRGWYMEIDALSGSKPLQAAIEVNDDGVVDDQDVITYSYVDENGDTVEVTEYVSGSSSDNLITRPVCITLDDSTEVCISNTSGTADANSTDECDAVGMSCQIRDPKSTLGRWTWQEL